MFAQLAKHLFIERQNTSFKKSSQSQNERVNTIVKALSDEGIYIIENGVCKTDLELINREIRLTLSSPEKFNQIRRVHSPEYGVDRYIGIDKFTLQDKRYSLIASSKKLQKLLYRQRLCATKRCMRRKVEIQQYHRSQTSITLIAGGSFKVFLYLNDVTERNCPFVYVKRTSKITKKRL